MQMMLHITMQLMSQSTKKTLIIDQSALYVDTVT